MTSGERPQQTRDWIAWHRDYDAATPLTRRLAIVQRWISSLVTDARPGPIRVVSMCAGDARDLVGALRDHPRRKDISGRLVEIDPELAARARDRAVAAAIGVDVAEGDAGWSSSYDGAVPANLILACGVFGNVSDADVERTIKFLPRLVTPGASVIWTRHRRPPDRTSEVRAWFEEAGFAEVAIEPVPDSVATVGVHRLVGAPLAFEADRLLFRFVPSDADAQGSAAP